MSKDKNPQLGADLMIFMKQIGKIISQSLFSGVKGLKEMINGGELHPPHVKFAS